MPASEDSDSFIGSIDIFRSMKPDLPCGFCQSTQSLAALLACIDSNNIHNYSIVHLAVREPLNFVYERATTVGLGGAAEVEYRCRLCCTVNRFRTFSSRHGDRISAEPTLLQVDFGSPSSVSGLYSVTAAPVSLEPIKTAPPVGNDVGLRTMVSFIIQNVLMSFVRYARYMALSKLTPYCRTTYNAAIAVMERLVAAYMAFQMRQLLSYIKQEKERNPHAVFKLVVKVDGCYLNRGHHSDYMTVTMFAEFGDVKGVVGVVHIARFMKEGQRYFVHKFEGSATGAEAFATEIIVEMLRAAGVWPDVVVLDGDSALWTEFQATFGSSCLVAPCFNHVLKATKKWMKENFAKKSFENAGEDIDCTCARQHHRWSGPSPCGCASAEYADHLYGLVFGMASIAKDNVALFKSLLRQLPDHFAGVHTNCGFHAQRECCGDKTVCSSVPCDVRTCDASCGQCAPGQRRRCFGNAGWHEPTCTGIEYTSRRRPVTCPMHAAVIAEAVNRLVEKADEMIVPGIGKVDTCVVEYINSVIAKARAKGAHPSSQVYQLMSTIGILRANQPHFIRSMRVIEGGSVLDRTIKREWLWEPAVFDGMACPLPKSAVDKLTQQAEKSLKQLAARDTDIEKVHRTEMKAARARANRQRLENDTGKQYRSQQQLDKLTRPNCLVVATGFLIILDLEFPGWGRYTDQISELCVLIIKYTTTADGVTTFVVVASFVGESRLQPLNPRVYRDMGAPTDTARRVIDTSMTEETLMQQFVAFLQRTLRGLTSNTMPAYFVAHNGFACDAPFVHMAMQRAGLNSEHIFSELHIDGLIDTLGVSKRLPWATYTPPVVSASAGAAQRDGGDAQAGGDAGTGTHT